MNRHRAYRNENLFFIEHEQRERSNVRFQFISSLEITALRLHNDIETIYYSKNKKHIFDVIALKR